MSVIAIAEDDEAAATRESGQIKIMTARAEELKARVVEMIKHAEKLLTRYHDANLTDPEKDLVNHVILQTQTSYEQDVVAKDNELRRREHLATGLNRRIHSLEAALAQMLKEKAKSAGPDAKTLLNFRMWLPSSPIDETLQALEEMIKPPSPISKPQPRATNQKKKSFKALEDADLDYQYDNRDNDLNDLSDLELSSPTGRSMRKRGSFYITATYCDRRGACGDKTKLGMHVPLLRYSPAVFQLHFSGSSESGCRYGAYHPVPAGRSFGFDFPSKVPDGPAKTSQKKRKWLLVVTGWDVTWREVLEPASKANTVSLPVS
ncbi:uncharacterized protein LACBIDRAFT_330433 [Laccaria bicolor S238N-H82]|uniref:Predicted protein n=1 Tax=Laccaria bicolor (strain S238N-H82 / ATCC MYA-4686) TaxID=486041 RepID=B0DLA6_LACBS|nr:uncharacterized protein LACBIDRAFT_330433 [Laccaria bicolor S238N-H82]EDR04531.1 predicted protein [Laccaria bicolor S238N-H82]|eukprot:XP_001884703.1 predicted protein [Laccaria bicolor S238N-H82]